MTKKVIVFGATGAIGTTLIETISKNQPSWTVLAASRSGGGSSHLASLKLPNVELVKGDVEVLESARELTKDVEIVYCCVGFRQYEAKFWAAHWPVVVDNLLQVTSESRPLIFCDNLYAYGATTNISPSKTPPIEATLKTKPGVRATLRKSLSQRMAEAPKSIAVVGGADFFGAPDLHGDMSYLSEYVIHKIVEGQKAVALGSAEAKHDFCSVVDFANALYVASTNDKALGKFWICPHSIKDKSIKDIASDVYSLCSTTDKGVQVYSLLLIKFLSLFMGQMREMMEMMPNWMNDYTVDDSDFCKTFQVEATPADETVRATIEYYQKSKK